MRHATTARKSLPWRPRALFRTWPVRLPRRLKAALKREYGPGRYSNATGVLSYWAGWEWRSLSLPIVPAEGAW